MTIDGHVRKCLAALRRGTVGLIDEAELSAKPNLHLRREIQLRKSKELGHTVVLVVGEWTSMVHDRLDPRV